MSREFAADLVVIGPSLGGVVAAYTAVRLGRSVVLTNRFDWLGGQLTTQAVPPDEHRWIESGTTSPSYRELRTRVRDHYRANYPRTRRARRWPEFTPGLGNGSRLCHEPRGAAIVVEEKIRAPQTRHDCIPVDAA
jgi:phytoene dehydrogenase-like protein